MMRKTFMGLIMGGYCLLVIFAGAANAETGSISGKVTRADGVAPVSKGSVYAQGISEDAVGNVSAIAVDGTYVIKGLKPDTYAIRVFAPGCVGSKIKDILVKAGEVTSGINFNLLIAGTISGNIVTPDGVTPIKGAKIVAYQVDGNVIEYTTSKPDGKYLIDCLKEGKYKIEVSVPMLALTSKSNVSVKTGHNTSDINFSVGKAGVISGRVTEVDGITPIGEAEIIVFVKYGIRRFTTSNADGTYIIEDLPASTYCILVMQGGYILAGKEDVMVEFGQATSNVDFSLKKEE